LTFHQYNAALIQTIFIDTVNHTKTQWDCTATC